ncbi:MAG TPA: DUF885 domain-containing protein [Steroidobacter sp.]
MSRRVAAVLLASFLAQSATVAAGQSESADELAARVVALADAYVDGLTKRFPEQALLRGLPLERQDGLTDNSQVALRKWHAMEDRWAAELKDIPSEKLRGRPEWIILGFLEEAIESSRGLRVCRYDLWPVNQMGGWQALMTQVAAVQPVGSDKARQEALARFGQLPRYLSTEIDALREGLRQGYSTPKRNVELVIGQLDQLLDQPVDQWPLYSPASRDESPEFRESWRKLLADSIKPAVERYRNFLRDEYVGKARESIAISSHPNGAQCYQASFRAHTTLDRPATETFELGRKTVEQNLAAALEIGRTRLGANDLPSLLERLRNDKANRFESREELLSFARAAVSRAREQMPQWFSTVPEADIVVEPYPDFLERTANDGYWAAAQDGSRPAIYRITLYHYAETTRSNAEITAFHEAYPGHHLQIGLANERPGAHPIAMLVRNAGFVEGWARYAEALAEEMGLYSSDYARANRRLWPARGMVIDPGIHVLGWTREQAIKYALESGRFEPETAQSLIDRIAVWPGQLTAYDTGALEFFALRRRAEEALGEDFDIREFHSVVVQNGAVTLPMLRDEVEHWLASRRAGKKATQPSGTRGP